MDAPPNPVYSITNPFLMKTENHASRIAEWRKYCRTRGITSPLVRTVVTMMNHSIILALSVEPKVASKQASKLR